MTNVGWYKDRVTDVTAGIIELEDRWPVSLMGLVKYQKILVRPANTD